MMGVGRRDMNEIWILGSIIVLRALLSFLIHYEMKHQTVVHTGPGE